MLIVLPGPRHAAHPISSARSTRATYDRWVRALKEQRVEFKIPRFEVHYQARCAAVRSDGARRRAERHRLSCSHREGAPAAKLMYETILKVDEKGVKIASAAHGGLVGAPNPGTPKVFIADRPFLFFIRDRMSAGAPVLVAGRVIDPNEG